MAGSQSLERGLEILELLDKAPKSMGVREISRRLELSPPIVQRLINTLSLYNYVWQDPDTRRYRIGYRAFGLGNNIALEEHLISAARPEIELLASEKFLNSYLGVLRDNHAVYVLSIQSDGPISIKSVPGSVAYLHSTAMGKALLSGLPDEEANRLLKSTPLVKVTPFTKTDPDELMRDLAEARRTGYTVVSNENIVGVITVGAPIRGASGAVLAAISCAFPELSTSPYSVEDVAELVVKSAERISRALGYEPEALLG